MTGADAMAAIGGDMPFPFGKWRGVPFNNGAGRLFLLVRPARFGQQLADRLELRAPHHGAPVTWHIAPERRETREPSQATI